MSLQLRALNRFGLGARPGEADTLTDPREWLERQLSGPPPTRAEPTGATRELVASDVARFRGAQRARDTAELASARRSLTQLVSAESASALAMRSASTRPFVERLVAFWSDHLCISYAEKLLVGALAGPYERDVIRAHVLGKYEEMVIASARHPAMLVYLDNAQSMGPRSQAAVRQRGEGAVGLNENYARELLELHTLGVDGGYDQTDVTELARLLTGWTTDVIAPSAVINFRFGAGRHEPGEKTVLGQRYGEGATEGERAIRALCRHPATARHLSTKLARHFIDDDPPATAVARLERVYLDSGGDLRALAHELIQLPECWTGESRKFRTPQDWLVAVLRATGVTEIGEGIANVLRPLRQPLWAPRSPQGYGDRQSVWADPDSLLNRAELARTIAGSAGVGPPGTARGLARRASSNEQRTPSRLATVIEPDDALDRLLGDDSIRVPERIAILIASPQFQWR